MSSGRAGAPLHLHFKMFVAAREVLADSDGNVDGAYCAVERLDRSGVSANAVLTVDT